MVSDENRELLFDAAEILGAHHVKVGTLPGHEAPIEQVTERYAELCADGKPTGTTL